ncbi:MAG: DUF2027 domain-containing protein [Prevotellaceae bacterium]|jgi:hypothetical protein|nr:DUF2027 domain-containing protein [Prevotellaceae bacterium]
MKYKIGDKVRFLNEVGGGTISKITGSGMVHVMDDDGFEIPVRATDIVVVGRDKYKETSSAISLKDELSAQNSVIEQVQQPSIALPDMDIVDSDDYELLLAFVPADQANPADCDLDLYFINDSSFYCTYVISHRTKTDRLNLLGQSVIEPETKEYVCRIDKTEFSSKLNLDIVSFLYKHHEYKYYPPEQVNVDLNPVKFIRKSAFVENDFFDEKAYILKIAANSVPVEEIEINPQELEQAMKQKDTVKPAAEPMQKCKPDVEEIDLHIETLLEDTRGLDNGQILEIQKARFTIALESGLSSRTKKMVFIHGVGNGKLKHEIRRMLDTQYVGLVRYYDASFQEYGFGATMVILR